MTDAIDLYAAVLADPFDMDLRLRYSGAVAGSDPDHAELIRLQITLDRQAVAGEPVDPAAVNVVRDLSRPVVKRLAAAGLAGDLGGLVSKSFLRRGFAEILVMSGADFLARGAELSGRVPWRGAVLSGVDAAVAAELAASPLLARLAVLDLSGNLFGDDGIKALVASPHLGRLRWLGLHRCDIGRPGAYALASVAREVLPDLRYVGFTDNLIPLTPYLGDVPDTVIQSWDAPLPRTEVVRPRYGAFLDGQFGPFPWLSDAYLGTGAPDYTAV